MTASPLMKHCRLALSLLGAVTLMTTTTADLGAQDAAEPDRQWRLNGLTEDARIHAENAPFWQKTGGNASIPPGSDLEVPEEGGIIRADIGAATTRSLSRFRFPPSNQEKRLDHIQGDVRYYVKHPIDGRFDVLTPQLYLSTTGAVFDVEVGVQGTQVDAIEGAVLITTGDRVSEIRLQPGQSARVSSTNLGRLEVRDQPGGGFATIGFKPDRGGDSSNGNGGDVADNGGDSGSSNGGGSGGGDDDSGSSGGGNSGGSNGSSSASGGSGGGVSGGGSGSSGAASGNSGRDNGSSSAASGNSGGGKSSGKGGSGKGGGNSKGGGKGKGGGNGKGGGKGKNK